MDNMMKKKLQAKIKRNNPLVLENQPALSFINKDKLLALQDYLQERLTCGRQKRDERLPRMFRTDRLISTWRKHDNEDTKRLKSEEKSGQQTAIAGNLPLLAANLEDLTAFYADTLAPQANPFISTTANEQIKALVKRLSADVQARNYYGEVTAASRAMIKYNIGGVTVHWDVGSATAVSQYGIQGEGNSYKALPMHNTFWDPAIQKLKDIPTGAEWGAYIEVTNRATLIRKAVKGELYDVNRFLDTQHVKDYGNPVGKGPMKLWIDPAKAVPTTDGSDSYSTDAADEQINWSDFGLSIPSDNSYLKDEQFEYTRMFCWVNPNELGLLTSAEKAEIVEAGLELDSFVELWRFEMVNNYYIVSARPHSPRDRLVKGETPVIPMFLAHMIEDDLNDSQRAHMELIANFQRMTSSIFELGIQALRADVYGHKFIDASMFDTGPLTAGAATGVHKSKISGRDVRTGVTQLAGSNGAGQAFGYAGNVLEMKNVMFPSQSLPAQVAGLDRAVTNQVSSIVHGAQRGLRMSLRLVDQSVFLPARLETVRNLNRYEPFSGEEISDEMIAKELGSGIESLESERITEALWRMTMAIIQNREAMEKFDVSRILGYLAQVLRINEDFSSFVRQEPQQTQPQQGQPAPGGTPGDQTAQPQPQPQPQPQQ